MVPPPPEFIPATEAVKTMQPAVLWSSGNAAFAPRMHPLTFTPNSSSQAAESCSSGISARGRERSNTPALPMKISSWSKALTVSATARLLSSSRVTSPLMATTALPKSVRSWSALAATRSMTPTRAPSSMKRATIARPMPEPPPVTSATCPSSHPMAVSSPRALTSRRDAGRYGSACSIRLSLASRRRSARKSFSRTRRQSSTSGTAPSELRWWRYRRVPPPVARQGAGVDLQISARDHGCIVRGQENSGLGVVRRTGESAQWHAGNARCEEASPPWARVARPPERDTPLPGTRQALRGVGGRRGETVDADAELRQFHRGRPREVEETALAGAIPDVPRLALVPGGGDDIDDAAAASLFDHRLGDILGAQEGPREDDGDLPRPFTERHVEDTLLVEDDRAVHENVDATEGVSRTRDRCLNLRLIGHVTHQAECFTTTLVDVVGASVGVVLLHVDADDPGAGIRHAERDTAADVRARTREERDLVPEFHLANPRSDHRFVLGRVIRHQRPGRRTVVEALPTARALRGLHLVEVSRLEQLRPDRGLLAHLAAQAAGVADTVVDANLHRMPPTWCIR